MTINLNENDLNYIRERTSLSSTRIFEYYKTFLSKFNNGNVDRKEFNEIAKKLIIHNLKNDENKTYIDTQLLAMCERLFDICDKDENGSIDFKEYLVLFWGKLHGTETEKLGFIFEIFDLNQSGYIDFHELHSIVKIIFKLKYSNIEQNDHLILDPTNKILFNNLPKEKEKFLFRSSLPNSYHISMSIMKTFDTDKNGKLTKKEFINGCLNHDNVKQFLTPLKLF